MRKFLLALVILSTPALALSDKPYLPASYNPIEIVPPPPGEGSAQQQRDLAEVIDVQKTRTDALIKRAESGGNYLAIVNTLGANLKADKIPVTNAFISKVTSETSAQVDFVKDCWQRQRPFAVSKAVQPPGKQAENMRVKPGANMQGSEKSRPMPAICPAMRPTEYSFSYPSGGASVGMTAAILLAAMVPEKTAEIHTRGREAGENRIILGVHFPSDVAEGRLSAAAAIAVMTQNPAFNADLADARKELRAALGYAD